MSSKSEQNFNTQLRKSVPHGTNESNEVSFVWSGRVMGISRKDFDLGDLSGVSFWRPPASVADVVPSSPFYRQGSQASFLIVERATETARRACSSRAMRCLHAQARSDTELHIKCTDSFQNSVAQNVVSHDRSRRRRVLSALGSLSRGCRERKKYPHRVAQIWRSSDKLSFVLDGAPAYWAEVPDAQRLMLFCQTLDELKSQCKAGGVEP